MSVIYLLGSNWELKSVLKALLSPYLDFGLKSMPLADLMGSGIVDDRSESGFADYIRWAEEHTKADDLSKDPVLPVARRIVRLKEEAKGILEAKTWAELEERLKRLLNGLKFGWNPKNSPVYESGAIPELKERIQRDKLSVEYFWEAMDGLFETLKELADDAPEASLEAFKLFIESTLGEKRIGVKRPRNGIRLLNYLELHGAFFDELFLMDLNDLVYPTAKAERSYFPEDFIAALAAIRGRRLWSSASESYQAQEEIIINAISQAKKVTLSWHDKKDDEKTALPSPIIASIVGMFPEGSVPHDKVPWPLPPKAQDVSDKKELFLYLSRASDQEVPPKGFVEFFGEEEGKRLWGSMTARREGIRRRKELANTSQPEEGVDSGPEPEKIPKKYFDAWFKSLRTYKGLPVLNVRQLSTYAACPRQFWYKEILKIYEWGFLEGGLSSYDQGILMHGTLEEFLAPLVGAKREKDPDLGEDRLVKIFKKTAREQRPGWGLFPQEVVDAEVANILSSLKLWLARDEQKGLENTKIESLEWAFGEGEGDEPSIAPYHVKAPGKGFYLKGRLDRLDKVGKDSYLITDYKMRKTSRFANVDAESPELFPSILYTLKVREHMREKGADAKVAARLDFIEPDKDGEYKIDVPAADDSIFSNIYKELIGRGIGMAKDEGSCDGCGYGAICGGYGDE
jgi:ATP-dependent helicase/DNAse subunit B